MNAKSSRELAAQAVIVLAVCVGAWAIVVKPKIDELGRLDQRMTEQSSSETDLNQQSVEDAARKITTLRDRIREINAFNSLASDSSRLYGIVMDLADAHGVQVHNLQPGSTKQTSNDGKVTLTRVTLGVEGDYAPVASFLDALCEVPAFIRPVSMQLDPARDSNSTSIEAILTCDVLSFAMDNTLEQLVASASGESGQLAPIAQGESGGTAHVQP